MVPLASGCLAMASIADVIARPSAKAGPIAPKHTTTTAPGMLHAWTLMVEPRLSVARR
ncbi:hypothetical protein AKJ09_02926 [Labilithrix luteola]|uniref:Uncharacterized protein n=1 Tax=Labilithrix luteola TaxID=1391654 RepID=A0A0K1PRX4_9BACT|nr:hypothetical protein AKJ09_02926 [Labilithrix luteola]